MRLNYTYWTNVAKEEYSLMSIGITAGIVAAVVLPLILIIVCVIFHLCRRREKEALKERRQRIATSYATRQTSAVRDPSAESMLGE